MLTYKAALVGIHVTFTEESYTSNASFLDADPLPVYDAATPAPIFSGRRVKRGLYQAASGRRLNADVNGAYISLREVLSDALGNAGKGIAGAAVHLVRLSVRTKRAA
jgi:putative transposase